MRCCNMPRAVMGEGSGQGIRFCHVLELQCVSRKTPGEDGLIARRVGEPEKRELPACDRSGRWLGWATARWRATLRERGAGPMWAGWGEGGIRERQSSATVRWHHLVECFRRYETLYFSVGYQHGDAGWIAALADISALLLLILLRPRPPQT